ncbi:cyclin-dependent kinase 2-interacting protein isoform X2 [Thunnus thynnus]|uniref:cyclin-dependent kinase 2-interacting protein isoform X2 n=1 Tax=Thunnus thynnus TaxID=8237 RepID=UPI00352791AD
MNLFRLHQLHHSQQVELQSCRTNAANCRMSSTKWRLFRWSGSGSHFIGQRSWGVEERAGLLFEVIVVMKMERLMASQRGVLDLEEFQFGPEGRKVPLFHSWTTKQFEDSSRVLLDAFRQELRLKQTILQELAHTVTSDLCMVYLSCWLHQPFIPPQTRMTLEALLLETGHRPL